MKARKFLRLAAMLTLILVVLPAHPVYAHPLGNFTINHFAGLLVTPGSVEIDYVLDMAEIPAFQEIRTLDLNGDRKADGSETDRYPQEKCASLRSGLLLRSGGQPAALSLTASAVEFPPGQGGLLTLRLTCTFSAKWESASSSLTLEFENQTLAERLGWREIIANGRGVQLSGGFATQSASNRLTSYPQDMLANPLDQRRVVLEIQAIGAEQVSTTIASQPATLPAGRADDAFTRLVTMPEITLPGLALAILISMLWGAMHALTPGHGKTIVGAYLVGSRGTARHAVYLGLITTITHTAGVFALGMITLFATRYFLPERIFPWLSLLSGLMVAGMGANLMYSRLHTALRGLAASRLAGRELHIVDHRIRLRGGALLPAPSGQINRSGRAFAHTHKDTRGQVPLHDPAHADPDRHEHKRDHDHKHAHSHLPPGASGEPVTARSLLALGFSGGLLPCPSALVVLLSAIALNRVGLGLLLVLAFSIGLAGVLTAIGMVFIYARRFFERVQGVGSLARLVPAASALLISLAGVGITLRALIQLGLLGGR